MYQAIYDLIIQYVYNGQALNGYQELVCTQVSTWACLFLMSLPFIVVAFTIYIFFAPIFRILR